MFIFSASLISAHVPVSEGSKTNENDSANKTDEYKKTYSFFEEFYNAQRCSSKTQKSVIKQIKNNTLKSTQKRK